MLRQQQLCQWIAPLTESMIPKKESYEKPRQMAALSVAICLGLLSTGCFSSPHSKKAGDDPVPSVMTTDIEAGIRSHIEALSKKSGGSFPLVMDGEELSLKLVKIHTEYLATLGPREHFACVDLVDTNGDVYDVDFFLHGDAGSMTVTETDPHKINGKPFYFWKQNDDKTWGRVPVDEASLQLMDVVVPQDEFEFRYQATLPELKGPARLWIPLPTTDAFQDVKLTSIDAPPNYRILDEPAFGNKILFWELGPSDGGKTLDIRYQVKRIEKGEYKATDNPQLYLVPEQGVPENEQFKKIASNVIAGKKNDLERARALYEHVINELRYAKTGEGWGKGDAVFACDSKHGNCTDYHSYFIALAHAVNIPARFAIGAAIPAMRNEGGIDGYHCWVEFYADGKWWPIDISEADKYTNLANYYFGHHPANRLEFSRGRDLKVEPGPSSGPINFLAYPILQVDGALVKTVISFSFRRPE